MRHIATKFRVVSRRHTITSYSLSANSRVVAFQQEQGDIKEAQRAGPTRTTKGKLQRSPGTPQEIHQQYFIDRSILNCFTPAEESTVDSVKAVLMPFPYRI